MATFLEAFLLVFLALLLFITIIVFLNHLNSSIAGYVGASIVFLTWNF